MIVSIALCFGLATWLLLPDHSLNRVGSPLSSNPWIRRIVGGRPTGLSLVTRVSVAIASASLAWIGVGWGAAPVAFLGVFVASGRVESPTVRAENQQLINQADYALDLLAIALRSGSPLRLAVHVVSEIVPAPTSTLLKLVYAQTAVGRSDSEAWLELSDHRVWGEVARDLARSVEAGTGLVDLLTTHAEGLRATRRSDRERAVRAVGVHAVLPLMSCFLPAFLLVGVLPIIASTITGVLAGG